MDKEVKLVKDRECVKCDRLFDCKGKPEGISCVAFTPRKENKGGMNMTANMKLLHGNHFRPHINRKESNYVNI